MHNKKRWPTLELKLSENQSESVVAASSLFFGNRNNNSSTRLVLFSLPAALWWVTWVTCRGAILSARSTVLDLTSFFAVTAATARNVLIAIRLLRRYWLWLARVRRSISLRLGRRSLSLSLHGFTIRKWFTRTGVRFIRFSLCVLIWAANRERFILVYARTLLWALFVCSTGYCAMAVPVSLVITRPSYNILR